jgi:hypothetical protein
MKAQEKNQLASFIVAAKANSYVGAAAHSLSYRPASHDIQFHDGKFSYLDSYFGGTSFIGQEVVYFDKEPTWAMNYYGRIINTGLIEAQKAGAVIMEALGALYREGRFLGGFKYEAAYGTYFDTNEGDVFHFMGLEWIEVRGERAYELVYHGGSIKT